MFRASLGFTSSFDLAQRVGEFSSNAAQIKANYAISYANAFVTALAVREKGTIVTGDPEFESVKGLAFVEWLVRPNK